MPGHVSFELARHFLKTKAVGFGETHDDPKSREAIASLMDSGEVTDLVLELCEPWEEGGVSGPQYQEVLSSLDRRWGNEYPLADLIEKALSKYVNVHCWDPGDSPGVTMKINVSNRNKAIANSFREHFGRGRYCVTNAPHCVILMGDGHFNVGLTPLDRLLMPLYWVKL